MCQNQQLYRVFIRINTHEKKVLNVFSFIKSIYLQVKLNTTIVDDVNFL